MVASLLELANGSIQIPSVSSSNINSFIGFIENVFLLGIAHFLSIIGAISFSDSFECESLFL